MSSGCLDLLLKSMCFLSVCLLAAILGCWLAALLSTGTWLVCRWSSPHPYPTCLLLNPVISLSPALAPSLQWAWCEQMRQQHSRQEDGWPWEPLPRPWAALRCVALYCVAQGRFGVTAINLSEWIVFWKCKGSFPGKATCQCLICTLKLCSVNSSWQFCLPAGGDLNIEISFLIKNGATSCVHSHSQKPSKGFIPFSSSLYTMDVRRTTWVAFGTGTKTE